MSILRGFTLLIAAVATTEIAAQPVGLRLQSGASTEAVTSYDYYVGAFSGTVLSDPTLPAIDLFSVDVLNSITWEKEWKANVTNLGASSIDDTRHGTERLNNYRKAAWLTSQYSIKSRTEWPSIQAAIWHVLNPGAQDASAKKEEWLKAANAFSLSSKWETHDWSQYNVLTPVEAAGRKIGGGTQEFITSSPLRKLETPRTVETPRTPETLPLVTPEPATLLLLATGLLGIVGFVAMRGIKA